ncbi:hypothetical protein MKK88_05465 [Methylobacterium sp. E-005]|uniref:hypothetical protein n=1 Tax=Methylobacterium sp. E-005 TaxID=2836549 RepID=UPI001FB987AC|nr:hypothetical protein [Methylobacterium sp. E-005]MCJ2085442.1 hypothetical protein [Methylobacterium sp. E-005]
MRLICRATERPLSVSTDTAPTEGPITAWLLSKAAASWLIISSGRPVAHHAMPSVVRTWHVAMTSGCRPARTFCVSAGPTRKSTS